jgi:DNA repair exonuclease SbcCD ATPase subunit
VKNDLQRIKNDLEQTRSDLQLAKNDIATANTAMSRMNAHKEELLTQKQALGKEASGLRQMILDMTSQLTASARKLANANAVKTNIAKKDQRIAELSERTAILEQELRNLHPATNIRKAQGSDGDLEARLRNSYDKLTATEKELSRSTSLIAELKERLAQLENAGETLKTAPIKANAEKKLLVDALLSKEQELAAVKEQLKDLQRKRNGLAMENNSPSTEKELSGTKEPYVSPEIPQDAISVMIHDRDIKIATLSMQVQALKEELAAKKIIRKEDLTKADDTFPAKATADEGLSVTNEKMDKSQARTKELISDIKTAKTTIKKNSRSSDEDLGELHRLMTLLDRERAELRALQIQIENEVKKARPAAKKNPRMSLMDCFTGCAPTAP